QALARALSEGPKAYRLHEARPELGEELLDFRPREGHDHERLVAELTDSRADELDGVHVAPVQVFEDEEDRGARALGAEEREESRQDPVEERGGIAGARDARSTAVFDDGAEVAELAHRGEDAGPLGRGEMATEALFE